MLGKATALGKKLNESFEAFRKKYAIVGSVRGLGAMLGLELVKGEEREAATETEPNGSPPSAWSGASSS